MAKEISHPLTYLISAIPALHLMLALGALG